MSSIPHVPTHLSHRHPLWWAALQENLVVQGYFLAQRFLVEVLAQVWQERESKAQSERRTVWQSGRRKCPILATRWQCTPREYSWRHVAFTWGIS